MSEREHAHARRERESARAPARTRDRKEREREREREREGKRKIDMMDSSEYESSQKREKRRSEGGVSSYFCQLKE